MSTQRLIESETILYISSVYLDYNFSIIRFENFHLYFVTLKYWYGPSCAERRRGMASNVAPRYFRFMKTQCRPTKSPLGTPGLIMQAVKRAAYAATDNIYITCAQYAYRNVVLTYKLIMSNTQECINNHPFNPTDHFIYNVYHGTTLKK